jgi:DNA-binding transcriptional LysR family regulator
VEREIGAQLFDRNSSRVFLTEAGSRLLSEARVVLQHAAQAVEATRRVQAGAAGTLRLAIAKGLGDIVSRIISGYLRLFPAVEIDVKDIASGFQNKAFDDRKIDVGFMRLPVDNPQLTSRVLFEQRLSVVIKKASPLAKRRSIRLRDLARENLLMIDKQISPAFYDKTLELFRGARMTPHVIPTETMPYDEAGAILVASGKGIYIAVGENPYHPTFGDRLAAPLLDEPTALMPVHIVWRKNEQARTVLEFIKYAESMFQKGGVLARVRRNAHGVSRREAKSPKRDKRRPRSTSRGDR